MNDSLITLQGYVGGDIRLRMAGDSQVASFRFGSTPRHYSRKADSWVDGPTQWYSVNCWRQLGRHVERSLRRGDPVVVHGRLVVKSFKNGDGVEMTSLEVEALLVGHDLNRGTTAFAKPPRQGDAPAYAEPAGPAEAAGSRVGEAPGNGVGEGSSDDADGSSSVDGGSSSRRASRAAA